MPDPGLALGFDTSAAHCAAAVVSGDRVLAQRIEPMARGQAERLFPLLEELLAEAGAGWRDLSVIGVGVGPGNFTGIRIAVAAARGLALSLGVPAVGVSATEAAAAGVPRPCRAVVALRGDEVVWEDFSEDGLPGGPALAPRDALPAGPAPLTPRWPLPVAIARLAARAVRDHASATGAGTALTAAGDLSHAGPGGLPALGPGTFGGEAEATVVASPPVGVAGDPIPRPAPLYLRPADAAPPRDPPPVMLP